MHHNSAQHSIPKHPQGGKPREGGPTIYSAGLLFNFDRTQVALIRKNRPSWQAGRLNAIGGHLEPGEIPSETQVREFSEETGCDVLGWKPLCSMSLEEQWTVFFFHAQGDYPIRTMTDEVVQWVSVDDVLNGRVETIPNLRWLIPMALQGDVVADVYVDPATRQEG